MELSEVLTKSFVVRVSVAGRWHFSFSHHSYEIVMFFFQRNSSPLFLITRSSSFPVIHVNVAIKNNVEKIRLSYWFFFL